MAAVLDVRLFPILSDFLISGDPTVQVPYTKY